MSAQEKVDDVIPPGGLLAALLSDEAKKFGAAPVTDQPINPPESSLPPAPPVGIAPPAPIVTETVELPKRGRPKGSKNKSKSEPEETAGAEPESEGITLYVDCFPIGKPAKFVERLVARAQEEIREKEKVADYRYMQFGTGAGLLAQLVAEYAKADGGAYVLDSRTPEGSVCKMALFAVADHVVQGMR